MRFRPVRLVVLVLAASAAGQETPRFGPWDSDLTLHESSDGLTFREIGRFVERGGVPSLVRDSTGRLVAAFQWFPFEREGAFDRVAVCISEDGGRTWTDPQPIEVEGLPESYERPYDPTLVPLDDGRIRIYFTSRDSDGAVQATYSAVGSDGVRYSFEPGIRFSVEDGMVIDCAVVRTGSTFHYFAPVQGADGEGYHAVSEDGLQFRRLEDVRMPGRRTWLGCAVLVNGRIRFYGTEKGAVWSAVSTDGLAWELEPGRRASGADPGVAPAGEGRWLMVSTGPLRADAGERSPEGLGPGGTGPAGRARFGSPSGGEAAAVVDGEFVYVLQGEVLRRFRASDLSSAGELRLGDDDGPRKHRVLSATSPDGLTWAAGDVIVEPASVPDAVVGHDGRVRLYFCDPEAGRITIGIEGEDGRWTFGPTNLRGADPNILLLEDGRYRAFTKEGAGPARIVAAESADGADFSRPATAFDDHRYPNITDSDVFRTPTGWVMYGSLGPRLLLARSTDGRSFQAERVFDLGGSVSDTIEVEGGFRMYFHRNPTRDERMTIWSAFSTDGLDWKVEGVRLRGREGGPDAGGVGDPAVIRRADGTFRMFYKSFIPDRD
ncbi:MAG: exo-alpha-sialidase [Planctomycetes bacterium]|nr:exo-alpha-sialidase [Planctomycetota bacterium]